MNRHWVNVRALIAVIAVGIFLCLLFLQPPKASAIPAFARKYQTSCATCHNDFPERNDFGEAFKKNGFRFPKDDETFVKEPPVLLGAKALREAFPNAIYPGEILGSIPIGFRYSGFAQYNSKQPLQLGFVPRTDLFAPNTFTMVNGNNTDPAARSSKDVYFRISQRLNLERDSAARKEVQAAGPTGPRDHTSIRFGAFGYYGRNALNLDRKAFPDFGAIREPFYRVGGDFRFKYRHLELYGLGMFGHDANLIPDPDTLFLEHARAVTFSGGFAEAEYWIYPWLIGIMRYDLVNSPTDHYNGLSQYASRSRSMQCPRRDVRLRGGCPHTLFRRHVQRWQLCNQGCSAGALR